MPAAAAVLIAVAAAGVLFTSGAKQQARAAQPSPSANTAAVERRTLSAMVSQPGTLTYRAQADGSPYSVINQAQGTYTELPAVGQVISQSRVLYRVNDSPVVLLYGSTPAYRTLSDGESGPDVAELNADLVALHYATSSQLSPTSASFGWATATALEKLQAALGVTQTGTLTLGQAVFEPTAVRVTAVSAPPGSSARPGQTVIQGTSTTRQVLVALDASQQTEVAVGNKVTITLPTTTPPQASCPRWGRSPPAHRALGPADRAPVRLRWERTPAPRAARGTARQPSQWASPHLIWLPPGSGIRPRCRLALQPQRCPMPWWCR